MISPDRMRQLDHWIGTPLCWGMTALRRARQALAGLLPGPEAPPRAPRRVLFVLLSESGSMVLADPAVRSLAADGMEVFFLTFAHARPALAVTGTVPAANIFSLRAERFSELLRDLGRWRRWVRARRIDALVDLELFACFSALLGAVSGIPLRVGFHAPAGRPGRYRGDLYTHPTPYDPGRHMALNYLALAAALAGRPPARDGALPVPRRTPARPADIEAVRTLLAAACPGRGPIVLVNPNASEFLPQRRWPVPRFVALVCRLLERRPDLRVLLIGGPADRETTAAVAASVADRRCADIAGRLDLPQLPALFAEAALLVSNDSGPAHFAAVADLPVVVLFGPETPVLYRPLGRATVLSAGLPCAPCVNAGNQRRTRCRDNRCMQAISVEAVLAAAEEILARSRPLPKIIPLPARTAAAGRPRKQA